MLFRDVIAEWGLVEFDFQKSLGINLRDVFRTMTWRRFTVLLSGLLATETLLNARFHPPRQQPSGPSGQETFD